MNARCRCARRETATRNARLTGTRGTIDAQCRTPYRVGNDTLSPHFTVKLNEFSLPGTSLYERFYKNVKNADPQSIRLAFHGTSFAAAKLILKKRYESITTNQHTRRLVYTGHQLCAHEKYLS